MADSEFFSTCNLKPIKLETYRTNHHGENFKNDPEEPQPEPMGSMSTGDFFSIFTSGDIKDEYKPHVRDPLVDFRIGEGIRDWWFGHATNLIQIGNKWILTDPVFDNNASPVPFTVRRVVPPPRPIKDLPKIDFVLISHNHWDHLCKSSVKEIFAKNPECHFFVPLRLASYLTDWGIKNVTEFDWRTKVEIEGIQFTCFPCHHGSSRWGKDASTTLWCSWMIQKDNCLIYYSGDTAIGPHFKEIFDFYGKGPDLFIVGIGPQNPPQVMRSVHLDGKEAIEMSHIIHAVKTTPMHYATFPLGTSTEISDLQLLLDNSTEEDRNNLIVLDVGGRIDWNGEKFEKAA